MGRYVIALVANQAIPIGDHKGRFRDLEDISTQVCDPVLDVRVRALDDGHHGDQRGYAHRKADDGERGPQIQGDELEETARAVRSRRKSA